MPLWEIYHSPNLFTVEDKKGLSERICKVYNENSKYVKIPKFYVGVVFVEVQPENFYIGGEQSSNFVRIAVDHIARELPTAELKKHWIDLCEEALAPYVKERGLEYEFHIDETPIDLWSIQGFRPPPANSEAEQRWIRENKPSAY